MSEQLRDGAAMARSNFNAYANPPDWRLGEVQTSPEGYKYRKIELDGYVLAFNNSLRAGHSDVHFIFADRFIPGLNPQNFDFVSTRQGGVVCDFSTEATQAVLSGRMYARQFHAFACDASSTDLRMLKLSAGAPYKLRLCGKLLEMAFTNESDPDVQRAVAARHSTGSDLEFDRSNGCPLAQIESVEVLGEISAPRKVLSFRVPFTRRHVEFVLATYHRPADTEPPRQIHGVQRIAMPMP